MNDAAFVSGFDGMLIKKSLRKCRILGSMEIGTKMANSSSYTGVLGMLQAKTVDLYLRGHPYYLQEDWLQRSVPIRMESIIIGDPIHDQKGSVSSFFNLLDNFKINITLATIYLFSILGILSFSFLIKEFIHRIRRRGARRIEIIKRIALALNSFLVKRRLSAIGLFVLFVQIFTWLTLLFLTNNIKVEV